MTEGTEQARRHFDAIVDPRRSDEIERLVSALHDPTRRRMLLALVRDGRPHTIDELSELVGVHRTVAFTHLERLAGLGYVEKSQRRGRLGKPASLYGARSDLLAMSYPARQFVTLAAILASCLTARGGEVSSATKNAAVRFGEQLALPGARSVAEALLPLQGFGAEYTVDGERILAGNCIFLEACDQARAVVCGTQAGILEGALRGAGIETTVEPQGPLSPRGCAYGLSRSKSAA
ncbi:MAG: ArsR family transcriptional regulator [Actinomycetota bacterium]|nr:ArsR family transcriptional regulator [Actinomycetota bacterium]